LAHALENQIKKNKSHSKVFPMLLKQSNPRELFLLQKLSTFQNVIQNFTKGNQNSFRPAAPVLASCTFLAEPTLELAGCGRGVCSYRLYLNIHTYICLYIYMHTYTGTSEKYSVKIEIFCITD